MSQSESDLTAAFYGPAVAQDSVEVPLKDSDNNELVTIDFESEVPEAEEVTGFLENEEAPGKFWLAIASCYASKNYLDDAELVAKKALEFFTKNKPQLNKVHAFFSWLALRRAQDAKTPDEVQNALLMVREHVKLSGLDNPLASLATAEAAYISELYPDAIRALEGVKHEPPGSTLHAFAQLIRAKVAFRRGRIHDSLKHFQAVLVEHPLLKPDPRLGIGLCFWALKDRKLATQAWKRALQIDPSNATAELLISLSKFDTAFKSVSDEEFTKTYGGALDSIKSLLQKNSNSPQALLMKASFLFSRGELDNVRAIATQIQSDAQLSKVARSDAGFWLGRIAYSQDQFAEAQKLFKDAMELNPSSTIAHLGYVQSLVSRGEFQDAIISLSDLVKKNPKIPEVHYALGMLFAKRFESSGEFEDSQGAKTSLQEYVKLAQLNTEPISVSAFLTLSRFYEGSDNVEALKYLNRAVESFTSHGEQAPSELVSNMGVLHFVQGSQDSSRTLFETALKSNDNDETGITLSYNLARAEETVDGEDSLKRYNDILNRTPGYVSAQMRKLFLKIVKSGSNSEIDQELDLLLSQEKSNLEVRAFYSWYLKKTGRGAQEGLENKHNKETLTSFDSHDTYALISLANMYRAMAREIRPKNDEEIKKRKTSYLRAAQLFHKALSIDPKNAFAAQGIAIVFAEEKQPAQAMEIFRRVRDAVDSFSVHINLGHCLCELGQYSKAIQEYSIALARFSDEEKDARTLSLIGRAWFARGAQEKSLESYSKSLEFSKKAYEAALKHQAKLVSQLQYNVAFVQFSIAQFLIRLELSKRTVEDIESAVVGLNDAIETFSTLSELDKQAPVAPDILRQRATMGSNTLKTQLERILKEQQDYEVQFAVKIEEAKRTREVERAKAELEEKKRKEEQEAKEQKLRQEFDKLQEQARLWSEERANAVVVEDEDKPRRGKKKNAIWTDEEASEDENGEKKARPKKKRSKKTKTEDYEDGDEEPIKSKKRKLTKREQKFKSKEVIEDSDEELDDFNDDDDDALERAEAQIDDHGDDEAEEDEEVADGVAEEED